jgi:hypothetical protein
VRRHLQHLVVAAAEVVQEISLYYPLHCSEIQKMGMLARVARVAHL